MTSHDHAEKTNAPAKRRNKADPLVYKNRYAAFGKKVQWLTGRGGDKHEVTKADPETGEMVATGEFEETNPVTAELVGNDEDGWKIEVTQKGRKRLLTKADY